jgi:urease accessory protein
VLRVSRIVEDIPPLLSSGRGKSGTLLLTLALFLALLLAPSPALAHEGTGLAGGFVAGFLHPLYGLDHMLAMVAVGLWGAFLGRPLIVLLPVLFPAMMTVGGAIGMLGLTLPLVELGIAMSVVTLGTVILLALRAPVAVAAAIVAAFALFHGYAHGIELPAATDPVGYSAGFVLCTGLLHVTGIALGLLNATSAGTLVLRGGGGLIALSGLWFTFGALA